MEMFNSTAYPVRQSTEESTDQDKLKIINIIDITLTLNRQQN